MSAGLLQAIKQAACGDVCLCLPVGRPPNVLLRPVATTPGKLNAADVTALTAWRNRYVTSFLTEFTATEAQTAHWLADRVGRDETRILFMVDRASDGATIGYMGLAFIDWQRLHGEVDAIVRGLPAEPGTMRLALAALMAWASRSLALTSIGVRVRSDNPAIAFYQSIGFSVSSVVPLRRYVDTDSNMIVWTEDTEGSPVELSLVHMRLGSS